ncbi:MAG: hypothetical protein HY721_22055 [Planctomycetes bacterium]|nr:hypothetical protein [Planctomycetota bacterium]
MQASDRPRAVRHHRAVSGCLERVRRRWRGLRLAEGLSLLAVVLGAAIAALFGLDNLLHLGAAARIGLLAAGAALALAVLWRHVLLRPFRVLGDEECAVLAERSRPELSNSLVNTVFFDREEQRGIQAAMVELVEDDAVAKISGLPRRLPLDARKARRLAAWAAGAAAAVALYAVILPAHFRNAAARYASPLGAVAPLTATRLAVSPGDAAIVPGESLPIRAETEGKLPETATLHLSYGASPPMRFDGRAFENTVERPGADFTYRVEAGDAWSEEFEVRIARPPEIRSLDVTVRSPEYTGLPPRVEKGSSGSLEVLRGSEVTLEAIATRRVGSGSLVTRDGGAFELQGLPGERFTAKLLIEKDVEYGFVLAEGAGGGPAAGTPPETTFTRRIAALPDEAPLCEVLQPGKDLEVSGGEGVPVTVRASDDVGLREASLLATLEAQGVARRAGAEGSAGTPGAEGAARTAGGVGAEAPAAEDAAAPSWTVVARWDSLAGVREAVPSALLETRPLLAALDALPGASTGRELPAAVLYRARAVDLKGQEAFSRAFKVRLASPDAARAKAREALDKARASLADVLRREQALRKRTGDLEGPADPAAAEARAFRDAADGLAKEQEGIRGLAAAALDALRAGPRGARDVLREVARAAGEVLPTVSLELSRSGAAEPASRRPILGKAIRGEDEAIAILQRAIDRIDALLRDPRAAGRDGEGSSPRALRGVDDKLRGLLEKVQEFAKVERDVLVASKALEGKVPEDFTAEETRALEELAAIEEKWGRLLEEAVADLSKVAPQDMSVGALAEEVVELVEEIDLARDYLKGRNIELAVPVEQSGVALAERIETNIERWLLRDRDRLKWVMEEPTGEFDVPLADLPSELEDIVGDLVDQEELMTDETEDVTSSWLDSMDDGIGWDAMDGPISNMSAKGVTGNLQPNQSEIGGRSGEGRSGRSQGQFVEETASGKGGRQTPTRSTADPFESGEVRDTGRDPTGGATGGGKLAGAGEQGLRGAPSPELDRKMGALARKQTELRQEAEQLSVALRRRRYYPQNLDRALDLMKSLEGQLAARRPYRYDALHKQIVSELRGLERVVTSQIDHRLDARDPLPEAVEHDLLNARGEEAPEEYRELIRDYYRSLGKSER